MKSEKNVFLSSSFLLKHDKDDGARKGFVNMLESIGEFINILLLHQNETTQVKHISFFCQESIAHSADRGSKCLVAIAELCLF